MEAVLNLHEVQVRPVERSEESLYCQLMATHHYLGYLPKIGQTLWYVATYQEQWVALLKLYPYDRAVVEFQKYVLTPNLGLPLMIVRLLNDICGHAAWAGELPAPQVLPPELVEEGRAIPVARVQAMHEGKRRARTRRG